MKFAYSKLSLAMLMAIGLSACGGSGSSGSSSGSSGSNNSGQDDVPVDDIVSVEVAYSIGDAVGSVVASQSESDGVNICLDLNKNNKCEADEPAQLNEPLESVVTLKAAKTEFAKNNVIVQYPAKGIVYTVAPSILMQKDGAPYSKVYINAVSNLVNVLGLEEAAKLLGTDTASINPIAMDNSEVILALSGVIETLGLTTEDKINELKDKLTDAYKIVKEKIEAKFDVDYILDHVGSNLDKNNPFEGFPEKPIVIGGNKPVADFDIESSVKGLVKFINKSYDKDGDALTYTWNFGDGTSSTEKEPVHQYQKNNKYTVTLIVKDATALFGDISNDIEIIDIETPNTAPVADATYKVDGFVVKFVNGSTDADNDTLTYTWDFGDGVTSTSTNPTHTYKNAGDYTVTLTVSDGKATATKVIKVKVASVVVNHKPTASFVPSVNGFTVSFANKSTDVDGDTLTYTWDFGDGTTSSDVSPKHTYSKEGIYKVVLTVNDGQETATSSVDVEVSDGQVNHAPVASFDFSVKDLTVNFANNSSDEDGDKLTYNWEFGDGFSSDEKVPGTYTYAEAGEYNVKLTVSDGKLSSTTEKLVKVEKKIDPVVTLTISEASASADVNGTVNFKSTVKYTGTAALTYTWNFGDGTTATGQNVAHTYSNNATYNAVLTVKDANGVSKSQNVSVKVTGISDKPVVKPCKDQDNEFCYGDINGCSKEECKDVSKEVCNYVGGQGLDSIETDYYATNPNGQVGKNKTISSMSDWTTDMIVAQGAANDDPRAYRGYHEKAVDLYALYAAWDDTNLYLMVEMPNVEGKETCSDFDYSCDQFLPMGIGIRTGKRPAGTGPMDTGNSVWCQGSPFYEIKDGIDTLLMFHPRLTSGTPGLFKTNDEGLFSYDEKNGYLLGFKDSGIERVVEEGHVSPNYWGISDNYGGTADNYKTKEYKDFLQDAKANGHLYQITIPLKALDIDKAYLEANGIGVVAFSTFGESMMDALPWTPELVDKASTAYSKDDSTSAEKEDFDSYDVRLASVGKMQGGGERKCETVTERVCETVDLPADQCGDRPALSLYVDHNETNAKGVVKSAITLATGFTGVSYTIEADGKTYKLGDKELTKILQFKKGDATRTVDVKITVTNKDGSQSDSKSFSVLVDACAADECSVSDNKWASHTGEISSERFVDDGNESLCKIPQGALAVKADVASAPTVYAYRNEKAITAAWPGDTTTAIADCTTKVWALNGLSDGDQFIVSNAGGERYPGDMQPGVTYSAATPCFDFASKKALSAEECGISGEIGADNVYLMNGSSKLASGSVITIAAKDDNPESEYVELGFMLYGKGVQAETTGTYTIDGEEYPFTNGEIIRIGEKIQAADTTAGEAPVELKLTLKYNDVTANYTIKKVKWTKPVAKNDFSWNNALVYFVMTDRFENGNKNNDNSYGRPYKDSKGTAGATFHGGDIVGMTNRLDYIKSLGMNAIWITAPYEQSHGWTGGGSSGSFAHYAYHGYYALDFTSLDANVGTVEEFRTFVNEAHKRGIRVVLDIVMNHSGYATLQDMCDFGFGVRSDGKSACEDWVPSNGQTFHNKPISESKDSKWDAWWGKDWLIFGGYGENCGSGDGLDACVSFLPDFKNTNTTGPSVSVPKFLQNKWAKADAQHDIPAAKPYRSGNMSVAQFQAHWLASWVEEFGIDGFRCDTAKHVSKSTWKLLKETSQAALEKWRAANKGIDAAADWTDGFWMTGEHWGYKTDNTDGGGYASAGGFDSMINFSFNGQANGSCSVPSLGSWKEYAGKYGVGSGSPKLNALTYVSSHDTSLCRPGNMKDLGTYLQLLPGGVQVYYGDETARKNDNGGASNDAEHGTRSDMNFPSDVNSQTEWAANVDTLSTKFSSDATLAHWQKVGQFRFRNVAVGAGKQTEIDSNTFCRVYNDANTGINNSVVIHVGNSSSVSVGSCFDDGVELQDAYSGATVTVSGGKVSIPAPGDLVLLELKR